MEYLLAVDNIANILCWRIGEAEAWLLKARVRDNFLA